MKLSCAIPSTLLAILLSACSQSEAPKAPASESPPPKANQPSLAIPAPAEPTVAPPGAAAQPAVIPDAQIKDDPGIMSKADALNLVLRDFVVQFGRPPQDLDELISKKVIARLPEAPAGMKFVYDRQANEVKVVKK